MLITISYYCYYYPPLALHLLEKIKEINYTNSSKLNNLIALDNGLIN